MPTEIPSNPLTIPAGTLQRGNRRVRPYADGQLVADSAAPSLVWEHPYYPHYAFSPAEVEVELVDSGAGLRSKVFGPSVSYDVVIGDRIVKAAATRYPDAPDEAMRDHTLFQWSKMSMWLEEDQVVHVHARSPYVRIDTLPSSRHVEVVFNGVTIADSYRPVVLFETGLAARYYLPRPDVRMDLLVPTETSSACPYKGTANYWSLEVDGTSLGDIVWGYETPLEESRAIAGLVSFWPARDSALAVYVDGVRIGP